MKLGNLSPTWYPFGLIIMLLMYISVVNLLVLSGDSKIREQESIMRLSTPPSEEIK